MKGRFAVWCVLLLSDASCASYAIGADSAQGADAVDEPPTSMDAIDVIPIDVGVPDDGPAVDAGCTATSCGDGLVCVHEYVTHDPPPPSPDGSPCVYGTPRYGRCWGEYDWCTSIPSGCSAAPACSCPGSSLVPGAGGCECGDDMTFNCYYIGI